MTKKKNKKIILEQSDVNVVPLMDILTTMLFFLILMASTANFSTLFATGEEGSGTQKEEVKFDLAIALHNNKKATIHLTDPKYLKPLPGDLVSTSRRRYKDSGNKVISREVRGKSPEELVQQLQKELTSIKRSFPLEENLTLAVDDKINYQDMINVMDGITLLPVENEFNLTDQIGRTTKNRVLFPKIALRGLTNGNQEQ